MADATHVMRRYGGSTQVVIADFDDLRRAIDLPEPWWAATACPVAGMRCDPAVLRALDTDGDGIVHLDDLRRAVRWTDAQLAEVAGCTAGSDELALAELAPRAEPLAAAARLVLRNLDAPEAERITLAQVRSHQALMKPGESNGDGIVPPERIEDDQVRAAAADILRVVPGADDRGGGTGVSLAVVDAFLAAREQALAWYRDGDALAAWDAEAVDRARELVALDPAVRGWFLLSRLAAVDPRRAGRLAEAAAEDPDPNDPTAMGALLASLPIAPPDPAGTLLWGKLLPIPTADRLRALRPALEPALAEAPGFDATTWDAALTRAQAVVAWADRRAGLPAVVLERARLEDLDSERVEAVRAICRLDAEWADEIAAIDELERLLLYRRWLFRVANNFICFSELYDPERRALFEHGSLFIGGRELRFAMLVHDRATHERLALASGIRVLYLEVGQGGTGRLYAVPVTAGRGADLILDRRGVFRDVDGQLHPGRVVQVVSNPVSLSEAIAQPFVRIGTIIGERLGKWQGQATEKLDAGVRAMGTEATPPTPAPAPAGGSGPLLGGSLAFAALGSSFAFVTRQLAAIEPLTILIAVLGLVAAFLVPTAILAWIKLYRRNLAALLEANGWAVNDRMRLTWAQGRLFTRRPDLPPGARSEHHDEIKKLLAARDPARLWAMRLRLLAAIASLVGLVAMIVAVALVATQPQVAAGWAVGSLVATVLALAVARGRRRRHPGLLGLVCTVGLVVVVLGGWFAWRTLVPG